MNYKKLLSLLAVSSFALAACGNQDDAADDTDTEETTEEESNGSENNSQDIIDGIEGEDLGYTAEVELELGGTWTADGRIFEGTAEEAAIEGTIAPPESFVYLIQNDEVVELLEVAEDGSFAYELDTPSEDTEYVVGASAEELYGVGDAVVEEDLPRSETVIVTPPSEDAEEETAE